MATSRERTEAIGLLDLASRLESIDINHDGEACSYFGISHGQCKGCPAYERDEICIDVALADAARRIRECCYGDGAGGAAHADGEPDATEEDDGLLRMCSKKWFEYARWVDGQGGLDAVKESVEQSACRKKLLDCFAMRLGFESLEDAGDIFRELEKRLMPDGMEWPRYEDGGLVQFGDIIGMQSGEWMEHPADEMVFHADGSVEVFGDGNSVVFERGEKARRIVLAADDEPLEIGQTVWHEDGTKLEVFGFLREDDADTVVSVGRIEGPTDWCEAMSSSLTHAKPEPPDSWERIEEDARKGRCSYFGVKYQDCCECTKLPSSCSISKARDLVRRCKALAERGGR